MRTVAVDKAGIISGADRAISSNQKSVAAHAGTSGCRTTSASASG